MDCRTDLDVVPVHLHLQLPYHPKSWGLNFRQSKYKADRTFKSRILDVEIYSYSRSVS